MQPYFNESGRGMLTMRGANVGSPAHSSDPTKVGATFRRVTGGRTPGSAPPVCVFSWTGAEESKGW